MTEPMHRLVQQVEPVQDQDIILIQKFYINLELTSSSNSDSR
jgi:hypothetical protein